MCHSFAKPFLDHRWREPSESQSRTPTCNRHRVPFFTRFNFVFSNHPRAMDSVSPVMQTSRGFWCRDLQHPSRRSPLVLPPLLRRFFTFSSLFLTQTSKSTMEPLKGPFPHVIMRFRMVRDPGSRFTESASRVAFVEKTRGPAASDGTNVSSNSQDEAGSSGTIKCSTLPLKSQSPGKIPT